MRAYITRAKQSRKNGNKRRLEMRDHGHASENQSDEIDESVSERIEARGKALGCVREEFFFRVSENKKQTRARATSGVKKLGGVIKRASNYWLRPRIDTSISCRACWRVWHFRLKNRRTRRKSERGEKPRTKF